MKVIFKSGITNTLLVPCGKCAACLKDIQDEWVFRLRQEAKDATCSRFYTLTYDDDHFPKNGELCKSDVQLFMKRLRKELDKQKVKVRYFLVGEFGSKTKRPHYHAIMFYYDQDQKLIFTNDVLKIDQIVCDTWQKGNILGSSADIERIVYCTKYILNRDPNKKEVYRNNHFMMCSRNPGLGNGFLEKHADYYHDNEITYVSENGIKQKMPRFYRKKIFDDLSDYERSLMCDRQKFEHEIKYREQINAISHKHGVDEFQAAALHRKQRREQNQRIYKKNNDKFNSRKL